MDGADDNVKRVASRSDGKELVSGVVGVGLDGGVGNRDRWR